MGVKLVALVPKNLGAFLAGNHDLKIAVGIQIGCHNVQPNACALGGDVLTEVLEFFVPGVVHDDRYVVGSRITTVMPVNALAGNQFVHAVAIQIRKMKGMGLTERIVDLDFVVKKVSFVIEALGHPCKDAVIMTIAPNQIVLAIPVDVADQHRARQALGPALMKLPWTGIGIALWSFVPTRSDHNVASSVIVQIAKTDPMATLRPDRMTFELSLFILIPDDRGAFLFH